MNDDDLILKLIRISENMDEITRFIDNAKPCIDKAIDVLKSSKDKKPLDEKYQMLEVSEVAKLIKASNSFVINSFKAKSIPIVKKSIDEDSLKPKYLISVESYKRYIDACQC